MLGFATGSIATLVLTFTSAAVAAPVHSVHPPERAHARARHAEAAAHAGHAGHAERTGRGRHAKRAHARTPRADTESGRRELPQLPPHASAPKSARAAMPLLRADVPLHREPMPKIDLKPSCLRPTVTFVRGAVEEAFALTRCDGSQAPLAVEKLSVMARAGASKPAKSAVELAKVKGSLLAPGVRRLDPRLVEELQRVVDHFGKKAQGSAKAAPRIHLVSGYRPTSIGSYHAIGHALDVHLEGVANEALVDFCKSLTDVGCGYYPNSSFVHMDVREKGTGHVSWIDASGPGESPRYVEQWPPARPLKPKFLESIEDAIAKLDQAGAPVATDEHPTAAANGSAKSKVGEDGDDEGREPPDQAAEAPAAALDVPIGDELGEPR
jgi:uncharacterized protein YcbK (DUF882 family)